MIRNQWYVVLDSKQVGKKPVGVRRLGENLVFWRIVAAFVPVDDGHTLLYLRFYQKFLPVPWLGKLVAQMAMPSNVYIAREDRRVVVTQQPKASGLKIGEVLIQGDLPIIEYRRKRAALQQANED